MLELAPITAVVVTYNADRDLEGCLTSIRWVNEIILVDLGSVDRTLEIARAFNCRILTHDWVPIVELVREEAIAHSKNDWVLVLDPDEVVSAGLADRLKEIALANKVDAVSIPWRNYVFGKWIAHSGLAANRHSRFFRKGKVSYAPQVHEGEQVIGSLLELPEEEGLIVNHVGNISVSEFVEKQNRYSSLKANELVKQNFSNSISTMIRAPFMNLQERLFTTEGYKDGPQGIAFCEIMSFYELLTQLKLMEQNNWELSNDRDVNKHDHLLSESRLGVLSGIWDLFAGLEISATTGFQKIAYWFIRRLIGIVVRTKLY